MITSSNINEILFRLSDEEIETVMEADHDSVKLEIHIFNVGYTVSLESVDYDHEDSLATIDSGGIYTDKDDFMYLLDQQGRIPEAYRI